MPELAAKSLRRASDAVEDFRGDYDRLAAMMQASWGESPAASYLYTAELLADCLAYPGASRSLAPSIYHGSELVAFAAGLPRRVAIGGAEHRIVISTYLTVAAGHKTAGYGIVVWSELMRRAAAQGFAGAVNYCVDQGEMDHMIDGCCRLLGLPLTKATSFFYLTRPLGDAMVTRGDRRRPRPGVGGRPHGSCTWPRCAARDQPAVDGGRGRVATRARRRGVRQRVGPRSTGGAHRVRDGVQQRSAHASAGGRRHPLGRHDRRAAGGARQRPTRQGSRARSERLPLCR